MKNVIFVFLTIFGLIIFTQDVEAQGVFDNPRDGVYDKNETASRNPVPYTPLREADVMWSKRIWRTVNMREKMNHPFYYPEKPTNGRFSFMHIIFSAIEFEFACNISRIPFCGLTFQITCRANKLCEN